ncbi:MAG: HigA family addiction module antidote protein [Candidatus Omnitrophica bacterium]|nr:HigA family addiction module antidote protein [Candidatus Omnitrophota bacterium]
MLPELRPPTHPGEMLLKEFMEPYEISQMKMAELLEISYKHVNELVNQKVPLSVEVANRIANLFGMPVEMWVGFQADWDAWHAKFRPSKIALKCYKKGEQLHLAHS